MLRPSLRWLPAVLWMAFIFTLSTGLGSAEHTSRFIGPFLHWLLPHAAPETISHLHFLIRKAAHFTEYAILAVLLRRAIGPGGFKAFALALLIAAAYAGTDEFHQSFVAGRTASLGDVLIDTFGAFVALAVATLWSARRGGKNAAIAANNLQ